MIWNYRIIDDDIWVTSFRFKLRGTYPGRRSLPDKALGYSG